MSRIAKLWCRSCQSSACLRWSSSCAQSSRRVNNQPLSSGMSSNWLITKKPREGTLPGFLGISSFHRGYSDIGIKTQGSESTVSNVPSTESSEVGATRSVDSATDACVVTASAPRDIRSGDATTDACVLRWFKKPGIAKLWSRSCQSSACLRWSSSCAQPSRSVKNLPLSSGMSSNWLITKKPREGTLPGFLGISSFHRGYSDIGIKTQGSESTVSNVPSTESSEVGTTRSVDSATDACVVTASAPRDIRSVDATTDACVLRWFKKPGIAKLWCRSCQSSACIRWLSSSAKCSRSVTRVPLSTGPINTGGDPPTSVEYLTNKSFMKIEIEVKLDDDKRMIEDPKGYINLMKLFVEHEDLCFVYTDPGETKFCFSNFALEILRRILIVVSEKGEDGDCYFHPDASQILIKLNSTHITEVAIPAKQFCKGNSVYVDKVVGPFGSLVYNLSVTKQRAEFKELYDLIAISQVRSLTLNEALSHPFFWTPEEKYSAIMAARIFLSKGSTNIVNTLSPGKGRTRVLTDFEVKLNKDFFEIDYVVSVQSSGECIVTQSADPVPGSKAIREWKDKFIGISFPANYRHKPKSISVFGAGGDERHGLLVIFVRDILGHFGDTNMDAYAATLQKGTILIAVIDLDREFSICLSIYYALRNSNVAPDVMPLAVKF